MLGVECADNILFGSKVPSRPYVLSQHASIEAFAEDLEL